MGSAAGLPCLVVDAAVPGVMSQMIESGVRMIVSLGSTFCVRFSW